jgi:hypothetical protein
MNKRKFAGAQAILCEAAKEWKTLPKTGKQGQ